jgi:hypothetical protein
MSSFCTSSYKTRTQRSPLLPSISCSAASAVGSARSLGDSTSPSTTGEAGGAAAAALADGTLSSSIALSLPGSFGQPTDRDAGAEAAEAGAATRGAADARTPRPPPLSSASSPASSPSFRGFWAGFSGRSTRRPPTPAAAAALSAAAASTAVTVQSVLAFEPMTVAFAGVSYTVQLQKHLGGGSKVLLHGIQGYALPGRMLALMGASGAGESD